MNQGGPYWSPNAKFSMEQENNKLNKLTPSAATFVPGGGSTSMPNLYAYSNEVSNLGMNASASAWVPSSKDANTLQQFNEPHLIEPYTEINYNGDNFFVPESIAYNYAEAPPGVLPTPIDEASMMTIDWHTGMSAVELFKVTMPAPPKRTLQTIGIPEPIHKHFQSLDLETLKQIAPDDERYKEIPPRYHSVFSLDVETSSRSTGGSFGYPSVIYKVITHNHPIHILFIFF